MREPMSRNPMVYLNRIYNINEKIVLKFFKYNLKETNSVTPKTGEYLFLTVFSLSPSHCLQLFLSGRV